MSDREERLERVIQKLEQTVLSHESNNGDLTPPVKGEGDTTTKVPARIREIVTKNLAADEDFDDGMAGRNPALGSLQEENRMLQNELSRVEDLLSSSRADRDELAIKYQALSDRVSNGNAWITQDDYEEGSTLLAHVGYSLIFSFKIQCVYMYAA
ncbi:rootletin-like [Lytechinus pictus]|uniref:rootletin-like n=1 Tax=Lytechinus pictus TaxID=7653 RepID=UPI00240D5BD2|nr:rootletin-like [Lytechinus pictus]